MNQQDERQRLINMRECLRWVQTRLPRTRFEEDTTKGCEFICNNIGSSGYDQQTKEDTTNLVIRAIEPFFTFNSWMRHNNKRRDFNYVELMQYRQRWIDQLCRDITKQLNQ